jgi:hypothetical protein
MVTPVELRVRQAYHHVCIDDGLQFRVSGIAIPSPVRGNDANDGYAPF